MQLVIVHGRIGLEFACRAARFTGLRKAEEVLAHEQCLYACEGAKELLAKASGAYHVF